MVTDTKIKSRFRGYLIGILLIVGAFASYYYWSMAQQRLHVEQLLGQKIILNLRYYCPEMTPQLKQAASEQGEELVCKTPMTQLPSELASLITDTSLGGVILFSDNLVSPRQIIGLTQQLQQAARASLLAQPLFISVDQEGGAGCQATT